MDLRIERNTIYQTITGSKLYGTNLATSDDDIRGVCIADESQYFGIIDDHLKLFRFEQYEDPIEDVVIWELRKVLTLVCNQNPNIVDLIFAPRKHWVYSSSYWENIYEHRHLFLSKEIKFTYVGYVQEQLRRMLLHRRWLSNVPIKPKREDFGLGKMPIVSKDYIRAAISLPKRLLQEGLHADLQKETQFELAMQDWKNYETWRTNRNEERAATEAKIGYDVKHGMHLIRALRMCKEILTTGEVNVDRRKIDAKELLLIRTCQVPYEKLIDEASQLQVDLEGLYVSSALPKEIDVNKINELCIETVKTYHKFGLVK